MPNFQASVVRFALKLKRYDLLLLLSSPLWSGRQKLLGVLVWPGGLSLVLFVLVFRAGGTQSALAGAGIAALVLVPPVLVAIYLYRAAGRRLH